MKIVIAPDSFKESLSALEVANAIEQGFKQIFPNAQYCKVPMADGGEGTVQAMVDATGGHIVERRVTGPLGTPVNAFYGILGQPNANGHHTAVIEMAAASGLHLVPSTQRNPLLSTSFGVGELIADALNQGIKHIILGLGGSATNDAGAGMMQALGAKLTDVTGANIKFGGAALATLHNIDIQSLHPNISDCTIEVACDVDNPLCGPRGASAIFGPQKGASAVMVEQLDQALAHFANVINRQQTPQITLGCEYQAGAGAAGGMGFGVMALLAASLKPGVEIVTQSVGLEKHCQDADLVITGEGRIDGQTVYGKTPMGVLNVAKRYNVPTIAIAGCLGDNADAIIQQGMIAIFPIIPAVQSLEQVLSDAQLNLTNTAQNIAAVWSLSLKPI
ncbi:glycerate kinase [Shewanella ulleungensis]|uniref:Glycerate kinase n=1 Tax=Shewanella ulleungensis TaxID=2282699 RepID=A0ABQ2QJH1_9GAMM|nr:glycerate kinase [Shewanella ulleungensis]MCL1150998.1 glycerate kinase [Shewanella ulleungensis]GGP82231.1 glycerate kinase [Shewanella ulleungensis]